MLKVAVIGSAVCTDDRLLSLAAAVGRALAKGGFLVLTGACGGIPQATEAAAIRAGGATLGISPASKNKVHQQLGLPDRRGKPTVWTGAGFKGRNVVMMESYADCAVMIHGGLGTLNESLICLEKGRMMYTFPGLGGAAALIESIIVNLHPSLRYLIVDCTSVTELMTALKVIE